MYKVLVGGLTLAFLIVLTVPADAGLLRRRGGCNNGGCGDCGPAPCPPQPCYQINWVEQKVQCVKPEWREREVQHTYNQVTCKPVVHTEKRMVTVTDWKEEERTITVSRMQPRQVERQVPVCRMERVCHTDPCSGCTYTTCRPVTEVQTVMATVWECVPEQRKVMVRVPYPRQEEREFTFTRLEQEVKPVTVTLKQRYCEMVPYETVVKVPVRVPVPCPQPAPCPGPGPCGY